MSALVHATKRAIDVVKRRAYLEDYDLPASHTACSGEPVPNGDLRFDVSDGMFLHCGDPVDSPPTCPECRRLLDEAIDPTADADRRRDAAWAGIGAAVKEMT